MKLLKSIFKILKEALIGLFNLLFPSENIVDIPEKKSPKSLLSPCLSKCWPAGADIHPCHASYYTIPHKYSNIIWSVLFFIAFPQIPILTLQIGTYINIKLYKIVQTTFLTILNINIMLNKQYLYTFIEFYFSIHFQITITGSFVKQISIFW